MLSWGGMICHHVGSTLVGVADVPKDWEIWQQRMKDEGMWPEPAVCVICDESRPELVEDECGHFVAWPEIKWGTVAHAHCKSWIGYGGCECGRE